MSREWQDAMLELARQELAVAREANQLYVLPTADTGAGHQAQLAWYRELADRRRLLTAQIDALLEDPARGWETRTACLRYVQIQDQVAGANAEGVEILARQRRERERHGR